LGPEGTFNNDPYYDAGNQNVIDEFGNIYFAGGASLVKVEVVQRLVSSPERQNEPRLRVYPNPSSEKLYFEGVDIQKNASIRIMDSQGKEIKEYSYRNQALDISSLSTGMYFVQISQGQQYSVVKFIKE